MTYKRLVQKGEIKSARDSAIEVQGQLMDETQWTLKGTINFVDVSVDKLADTVTVRATLPNPDGVLIDSELVRVNADFGKPQEKIMIPQSALIADQQGIYVFAVEDGKAVIRRVQTGGGIGVNVAVESGLKAGEQVISNSQYGAGVFFPLPGTAKRGRRPRLRHGGAGGAFLSSPSSWLQPKQLTMVKSRINRPIF